MEPNIEDREAMERGMARLKDIVETSGRSWGVFEDYLFKWAWLDGAGSALREIKTNVVRVPMASEERNV